MLTTIFWACVAISVVVFGVMLYSVATFRRTGDRAILDRHATAEVLWASVPIAILVLAAVPAVRLVLPL